MRSCSATMCVTMRNTDANPKNEPRHVVLRDLRPCLTSDTKTVRAIRAIRAIRAQRAARPDSGEAQGRCAGSLRI